MTGMRFGVCVMWMRRATMLEMAGPHRVPSNRIGCIAERAERRLQEPCDGGESESLAAVGPPSAVP